MVICIAPWIRVLMWYEFDASPSAMTREFQAVADALATGCVLAYIHKDGWGIPRWFKSSWFYLVPLAMFIVPLITMKLEPALFYIFGQSVVNICAAAIIWRFMHFQKGLPYKLLNCSPVIWLGTISYSLYLWQEPFLNSWVQEWYAGFPLNILLAFGFAVFSYYAIEKPFLKMRKKLLPRKIKPSKISLNVAE